MFRPFFMVLYFGLMVFPANAQQDSTAVQYDETKLELKKITGEDLRTYREDPDFDYEIVKTEIIWWNDFLTWLGNLLTRFFEWLFGVEKAAGYLVVFFKVVPYILIALLLFLLIKFFLNVNTNSLIHSKKNEAVVALSEEEHIIKNENIDELIQLALKEKDYRLAIRYYYLLILKLLSSKEHIEWELQKTNDDYINEIKATDLKKTFGKITYLYDYIWYGGFHINESNYRKAEAHFSLLKKSLAANG